MRLHRTRLLGATALLFAMSLVPLVPGNADAATFYSAMCSARLRATPSTSATSLVTITTGSVVTVSGTVSGGAWSASCPGTVSGSTWYSITAINGATVSALYGVSVGYAATGLFQATASPPPSPTPSLEGMDVSRYQGTIDWTAVAGAGKRFVIMKATQGETYSDPTYATNHAAARAVGIPVAAYHFADPSSDPNDAVIQADWFANNAALLPGDMIPALDLEETGGLSVSALQAWVGAWLGEVYARVGVRPMIYTSPNFWTNSMGNTTTFADQGYAVLWIAHWGTSSPTVPANNWSGHGWTFWQYSNCGTVPGISGCVDLDRYNGTDLSPMAFNYTYIPQPIVQPPNAAPFLAAINPTSTPAGSGDVTIDVQGSNFAAGVSTVYINGVGLLTTYVSPTELTAIVPAALTTTVTTGIVTVVNQPPGGGSSSPATFTVTLPPAQVSLTSSTPVVAWGQAAQLDIQIASGGANRTVTIQRMQANETQWSDIGTVTTDATGHATFTYTPPVNTQFQAVFAGAADLGPGTSAPMRVVVRQLLVLRPTSLGKVKSVPYGTRVTFTATVRPIGPGLAPAKVTFQFWRNVSGKWQLLTKRDVYVDATGRAAWSWTFSWRGQWYVRAIADPTVTNANSVWSAVERYSVS